MFFLPEGENPTNAEGISAEADSEQTDLNVEDTEDNEIASNNGDESEQPALKKKLVLGIKSTESLMEDRNDNLSA